MRPLQVWIPLFGPSIGFPDVARDMYRAYREWEGEIRVWILPGLNVTVRWLEERDGREIGLMAVPGDRLECLDVYHVGENGYVFGPGDFGRFPNLNIEGLLDAWLGLLEPGNLDRVKPFRIYIKVPEGFGDDGVAYQAKEFAGPAIPMTECVAELLTLRPVRSPATVFPEAELAERLRRQFGTLVRVDTREGLPVIGQEGSNEPLFVAVALCGKNPLLEGLFSAGVSIDAVHHCRLMNGALSAAAIGTRDQVLRVAHESAGPYVSQGWSPRALSWYRTTCQEEGASGAVISRGATLGLNDVRDFKEMRTSEAWRKKMTERVRIRRVWGPIGLFWALILERLEDARPISACQRCGGPIEGGRRRKYCSRKDNEECFLAGRAAARRRARTKDD